MSGVMRRLSKNLPGAPPLLSRAKSKKAEDPVLHPEAAYRESEGSLDAPGAFEMAPESLPAGLFAPAAMSGPPKPHRQSSREIAPGLVPAWLEIGDDKGRNEAAVILEGLQGVFGVGVGGILRHLQQLEKDPDRGATYCLGQLCARLPAKFVYAFERVADGAGQG